MINTLVAAVGTMPSHQLEAVAQLVLVAPDQVPVAAQVATFNFPVAVAKKVGLIKVAPEVVPPYCPLSCPVPPKNNLFADEVKVPKLAITLVLIVKSPEIVIAAPVNVFVPLPPYVKLLNVVPLPGTDCPAPSN